MKPTDIVTCLERKHQDGDWRLVFFENLWSDPFLNVKCPPAMNALGMLGERKPLLFWLLAHIETDYADQIVKPARLRLERGFPHKDDEILARLPHHPALLEPGTPTPNTRWGTSNSFNVKQWFWINGTSLTGNHIAQFDYDEILATWHETLMVALDNWAEFSSFFPVTWDERGAGTQTLETDAPYSSLSAHQKLQGMEDAKGLLPITAETYRLIIGFD